MDPSGTRVLIVDDNPGDARLVEYSLAREPGGTFHCARAARIGAALEHVGAGGVDVVLLDLGLPDSQGTEGLRRIRAKAPQVAIVVLTGAQNPDLIRAAMAAGAQDYLVKGIFPKGYLAWAIRVAILFRCIENDLAAGRPLDAAHFAELSEADIGVAVFALSGLPVVNEAFSEFSGVSTREGASLPGWLADIVGGPSPATGGPAVTASPTRMDLGEVAVDRPGTRPIKLEYVVRRFPSLGIPRVLVFLREISADRPRRKRDAATSAGSAPGAAGPLASKETARPSAELLDPTTWANLRELAGMDSEFLPALVAAYLKETRRLVGALQSAADEADSAAITRGAHTLKSGCAQVGALALSARCATLEYQAETGNLPDTRALILQIARDFQEVSEALKRRYPRR
jgi:DNA-binding NarL/FixJ family response regulator/HPt (histidine-containing phosphotransfer) domain-containing protein